MESHFTHRNIYLFFCIFNRHSHQITIVESIQIFDLDIDVIKKVSFPLQMLQVIYAVGLFSCNCNHTRRPRTTIGHKPSNPSALLHKRGMNRKRKFCWKIWITFQKVVYGKIEHQLSSYMLNVVHAIKQLWGAIVNENNLQKKLFAQVLNNTVTHFVP